MCDVQQSNPDISGIGIRSSFYLQNFVLVLLVNRSWEDAPAALWTFITTSFGLTIAAIASAGPHAVSGNKLSLYEAIQVSNLVWLANFGTFLALASYSRQKTSGNRKKTDRKASKHDNFVKFGAVVQTFLSMVLTLYMWVTADTFGGAQLAECNASVLYVVFGANLPALGAGRAVGLVFTALLSAGYVGITCHELLAYWRSGRMSAQWRRVCAAVLPRALRGADTGALAVAGPPSRKSTGEASSLASSSIVSAPQSPAPPALPPAAPALPPAPMAPHRRHGHGRRGHAHSVSSMGTLQAHRDGRARRRRWLYDLDPMLVGIIVFQFGVFAYFIACNELYVALNNTDRSDAVWGFGQILALIVVIPSLVSVVRAFHEHRFSHLDRRPQALKKYPKKQLSDCDPTAAV